MMKKIDKDTIICKTLFFLRSGFEYCFITFTLFFCWFFAIKEIPIIESINKAGDIWTIFNMIVIKIFVCLTFCLLIIRFLQHLTLGFFRKKLEERARRECAEKMEEHANKFAKEMFKREKMRHENREDYSANN